MTDIIGTRDFSSAYNDNETFSKLKSQLESTGSNEDFYEKLVALKNDQKKTLMVMEELYNQKQLLKTEVQKSEATLNDLRKPMDSAPKTVEEYRFKLNTVSAYGDSHVKYPLSTVVLGQAQTPAVEEQRTAAKPPTCPTRSSVSFQKSVQVIEPEADEPVGDLSSVAHSRMLDSLSEGMKKIETMWDNFSLNEANMNDSMTMRSFDFNDRFERKPKIKTTQPNTKKKSIEIEWVPRVTIPEPFSMSIRDQVRYDKRKDKVMNEMREERERRIEAEIRECKKKFKAKPVPKHVRMPLYEQQRAQDEMRKQKIREMSRETHDKISTLNSMQQEKLENGTIQQQQQHTVVKSPNAMRRSQTQAEFTAQPLPSFYFNENAEEEMKETEMYKQIQRQMRALEMLKESKLPHNMGLMEEKKLLEMERNQLFITEMNNLHKELNDKALQQANLRKNHDVPDYEEQFKNFTIQMEKRKAFNRKNTRTVPFHLRSASRTGCRKACDVSMAKSGPQKSAALNRSSSSMSRLNRSLSASMDSMPIKNTESQRLRESVTRNKLNEIAKKESQQEHIDKMKALRAKKLAEQIKEKSNFVPNEVDDKISRQTRKLKLEQRRREEEYEQSLAEMGAKVNSRKLQIEHIEEENRKKALEKKMNEAMEKLHKLEDYNNKASASSGIQRAKPVSSATYEDNDWINEA